MKIAILQNYIFPYLGYYQLYNYVDKFIYLEDCNYIGSGWVNRNRILNKNTDLLFTVPLEKASQNVKICDTKLSQEYPKWKEKFYKTLLHSYSKAPYYKDTLELIKNIMEGKHITISTLAKDSINKVFDYLDVYKLTESSTKYNNLDLKGQDRIVDICIKENATHYINPIGGRDLYSQKVFNDKKIELSFLRSELPKYEQFGSWTAGLSMIDILMFNSKQQIRKMLLNFCLEK